jgi:hypothetical protein
MLDSVQWHRPGSSGVMGLIRAVDSRVDILYYLYYPFCISFDGSFSQWRMTSMGKPRLGRKQWSK